MGPDIAQRVDGIIDHHAPLILDAEGTIGDDFSDLVGLHTILSRSFESASKHVRRNGNYGARTAFAKEGEFGGSGVVGESNFRTESGHGMPCPYKKVGLL